MKQPTPIRTSTGSARRSPREKLLAVLPMLELRSRMDQGRAPAANSGNRLIDLAHEIARCQRVNYRSAWRWYCDFLRNGFAALVDRRRADYGQSRFFEKHPDAAAFVRRSYRRISAVQIRAALAPYSEGQTPALRTVRDFIRGLRVKDRAERLRVRREARREGDAR